MFGVFRILNRFRSPNTSLPPLLLFDFDGVIADSLDIYLAEFTALCTELGIENPNPRESLLNLFDGNLVRQVVRAGFPLRKLRALALEYAPRLETVSQRVQPFPGISETLDRLGRRHPVLIITSNSAAVVRRFMERHGLQQVQGIIGAEEETSKVKKIRAARRRYPKHCPYYIGDTKGDIIEARHAGAVPVAAAWGWHDAARLRQGKPRYVLETHLDLLSLFEGGEKITPEK